MRRICYSIGAALLFCAAAALPAVAGPASDSGPVIDWDPAYFYEAGATPINSSPGGLLYIVGTISNFGGPLAFLNPNMPAKEYTFYMYGMTSTGTTTTPFPPFGSFYTANYTGGTIDIYEDASPDAVFDPFPPNGNVPSTFTDLTLILTGSVNSFYWQSSDISGFSTGNAEANILWTGGLHFDKVQRIGGEPCPSLWTGGTTWLPSLMIDGYLFRHDGKIDLECPTPTRNSTWGRLKSLYR